MKTVLITKKDTEVTDLKDFCALNGCNLMAHSFIDFESVKSIFPEQYDWIFFGSKRAVDFFLDQHTLLATCKVACIGSTTAKHLITKGIIPDFVGDQAGDATAVASSLSQVVGNQILVIPISSKSKHSIANVIATSTCHEVVVYQTKLNSFQLTEQPAILIFTSPSNVEGFLRFNSISSSAAIVAWGKTTEKFLIDAGYSVSTVLKTANLEELPAIIHKLIS